MRGRDFLDVAFDLAAGLREADWRSAASRAYYAGFHSARDLLSACAFSVPVSEQAHVYLWRRLRNSSHPDMKAAGAKMDQFRQVRNSADYDTRRYFPQNLAMAMAETVEEIIKLFEALPSLPQTQTEFVESIRRYERDVLREDTWKKG
jgi:uncharacterized protein (UPF0332 family)